MREGVFNKLLASPIHRTAIFVGKTLVEAFVTTMQVLIELMLAVALGATIKISFVGALGVIAIALLFSLGFAALSNIVALIIERDTTDA